MSLPRMRAVVLVLLLAVPVGLTAASGIAADPLAGYPEGTYVLPDGRLAIPLRAPTPSSYTPGIHEKVLRAAENGMAYDPATDSEVALSPNFLFIRPGAWMWSPSWCTMNFIYGAPGSYKIGSAGHCNAVGQDVVLALMATTGSGYLFVNIGRTEASHNNGVGDDYSITAIRSNFQQYVDANVAVIGGPQGGAFTGTIYLVSPLPAKHFGHGLAIGTGGTPRAGVVIFSPSDTSTSFATSWWCECAATPGDSGSGVLVMTPDAPLGQALGVLTHLVVGSQASLVAGTRADAIPYTVRNGDVNPLPPA